MTSQSIEDIGLWEVWIEYDEFDPTHFGTLYIFGEISIDQPVTQAFRRLKSSDDKKLLLQVPSMHSARRNRVKEVLYSEPLRDIDTYTSVYIYAGKELIASFDDIDIMI